MSKDSSIIVNTRGAGRRRDQEERERRKHLGQNKTTETHISTKMFIL